MSSLEVACRAHGTSLPDAVFEPARTPGGQVLVAREDLLAGGTKQRAIQPYLNELIASGYTEFVYASPFCGFAQVALAAAARDAGAKARLFCEAAPGGGLHAFSRLAQSMGARAVICSSLAQATARAEGDAEAADSRYLLPLGFRDPAYEARLRDALARQLALGEARWGRARRIWVAIGSGTLIRALSAVSPPDREIIGVDVGVLDPNDARLRSLEDLPNVSVRRARESFHEPAREPPRLPSNAHYDAKLWRLIRAEGRLDDLWWNVAR